MGGRGFYTGMVLDYPSAEIDPSADVSSSTFGASRGAVVVINPWEADPNAPKLAGGSIHSCWFYWMNKDGKIFMMVSDGQYTFPTGLKKHMVPQMTSDASGPFNSIPGHWNWDDPLIHG